MHHIQIIILVLPAVFWSHHPISSINHMITRLRVNLDTPPQSIWEVVHVMLTLTCELVSAKYMNQVPQLIRGSYTYPHLSKDVVKSSSDPMYITLCMREGRTWSFILSRLCPLYGRAGKSNLYHCTHAQNKKSHDAKLHLTQNCSSIASTWLSIQGLAFSIISITTPLF